ncbi:MAG TPA: hypothetical protein VJJ47_00970 [Candidatus Paceibacterota bacterium]
MKKTRRQRAEGRRQKGGAAGAAPAFVLLYAVVVASMVLAVGISIISIATKQVAISGLGRESQYAFYAANTGTECALFWDLHGYLEEIAGAAAGTYSRLSVFPSPLTSNGDDSEVPAGEIIGGVPTGSLTVLCSGTEIMSEDAAKGAWSTVAGEAGGEPYNATTFTVRLDPDVLSSACAVVTITKQLVGLYELETVVDSRGYNTCDENSFRRVERGLRYTY